MAVHTKIVCDGQSVYEGIILHAHLLPAHLESTKTLCLLCNHVWWKLLRSNVQKFCETCQTCEQSKPANQKPYSLLNLLSVPTEPWKAIGMDFVGPLLLFEDHNATYNSITVIIYLLMPMVHLIPNCTMYTAKNITELKFAEVYKLHSLPQAVISDHNVLFISILWTHLHKLLRVELRMSSVYHPELDGFMECVNRTIVQMLCQYIDSEQRD